jgi:RNA polymerase sigma-70 factor (ECF subfamily)
VPECFDEFYRATSRRMLRYAYGLTGDSAEAQDVTQEAYVRAWRRWPEVVRLDDAEAWVRLVATRLATDRWRRLRVRRGHEALQRAPDPVPPPSENTVLLVRALRGLPIDQRRALCLHYLLDLPVADIARELGVPAGTVKSWLSRGRAALAAQLGPRLAPSVKERDHAR